MTKKRKSPKRKAWVDPDVAPEMTDEFLDRFLYSAEIREGDKIIRPGQGIRPGVSLGSIPTSLLN
jgi:hypothetical protein